MSPTRILVVDDEPDIRELLCEILEEEGYAVTAAADAAAARRAREQEHPDLALLDVWMPDTDGISLLKEWSAGNGDFPVIMLSGHGTIETAVEATRYGAYDFVEKPLSLAKLLLTVRSALSGRSQRAPEPPARSLAGGHTELVGGSRALAAVRDQVERLARTTLPVLVRGEPGAGKRTVAHLLHERGAGPDAPLVEVDVGAVGVDALSDCLFGADGAWSRAAGGTVVLQDLAELDTGTQARLLERLQQRGEGDGAPRLVALSAEELTALVESHRLRADLFHALNAAVIHVPPLRDHPEDVPELLGHFVNRLVEREGMAYRHFSVPAQNRLRNHEWPGNVAELLGLVRRLLALGDSVEIGAGEVDEAIAQLRPRLEVPATSMPLPLDLPLREAREAFERAYLQHQLRAVGGRIGELARRVGMERTHLYRKLKTLGIEYGSRERG